MKRPYSTFSHVFSLEPADLFPVDPFYIIHFIKVADCIHVAVAGYARDAFVFLAGDEADNPCLDVARVVLYRFEEKFPTLPFHKDSKIHDIQVFVILLLQLSVNWASSSASVWRLCI